MWYVLIEIAFLLLIALLLGLLVGWLLWRRGRVSMSRADHEAMLKRNESDREQRDQARAERDGFDADLQAARHDRDSAQTMADERDRQLADRDRELRRLRSDQRTPPEPVAAGVAAGTTIPAGAGWALPASDISRDDLQDINGIGPDMEALLNRNGIRTHRQLANLSRSDVDVLQAQLEGFPDRIRKDNWVGQARDLSIKAGRVDDDERRRWWSF